jgi:hypothetical protein
MTKGITKACCIKIFSISIQRRVNLLSDQEKKSLVCIYLNQTFQDVCIYLNPTFSLSKWTGLYVLGPKIINDILGLTKFIEKRHRYL